MSAAGPAPERNHAPLGVVGGMGPLASAELLATIYRHDPPEREQEAPAVVLLSDPSVPDRSAAILRGETGELARRLAAAIRSLVGMGAERVVVACFTIHHVLPELPEELRRRVVSLVDLTVEAIRADPRPRLVLATTGSRRSGLFTSHPRWGEVAGALVLPGEEDQEALHERLYRLKRGESPAATVAWLEELGGRHPATEGFVFGCTELHLLARPLAERWGEEAVRRRVVDALTVVARRARELAVPPEGGRW